MSVPSINAPPLHTRALMRAVALAALALAPVGCKKATPPPAEPPKPVAAPKPLALPEGSPDEQRVAIARALNDVELEHFAKLENEVMPLYARRAAMEAAPANDAKAKEQKEVQLREIDVSRDAAARNVGFDPAVARVVSQIVTPWYINELRIEAMKHALDRIHNGVVDPKAPKPNPADPQAREREISLALEKTIAAQRETAQQYGPDFLALMNKHKEMFVRIYSQAFPELQRRD